MMLRVLVVVIAGVAVAATSAARVSARSPNPDETSYAELVAANYRLLSLAESQRLVRFAAAFSSCLGRHGVRLGAPRLTKTLQTVQRFGDTRAVVLYVPRQCLLDPKAASS